MSGRLNEELKQDKPFSSLEVEAFLNIQKSAEVLMRGVTETLKAFDLSATQYNVLRILRGAGAAGLACSDIAERMVNKDPDITRLLDRLEQRGLVTRGRDSKDRRVVTAKITADAKELLARLDAPIDAVHQKQFEGLGQKNLRQLVALLEEVRANAG